jgi:hypothetical protein
MAIYGVLGTISGVIFIGVVFPPGPGFVARRRIRRRILELMFNR